MMQLSIGIFAVACADQRKAMVIRVAAQKHHAAGHHIFGIDVRDFEAENSGVEIRGPFEIGYLQYHMADLADIKIHSLRWRQVLYYFGIDSIGSSSIYVARVL